MAKTTQKELREIFARFCKLYDFATSSETREGEDRAKEPFYKNDFLELSYVPQYGGYVIHIVNRDTSVSFFHSATRLTAKEMKWYLLGLMQAKQLADKKLEDL